MFEHIDNEYFKVKIESLQIENNQLKEVIKQLREQLMKYHLKERKRSKDDYDYLPYEEDDRS